MRLGTFVAVAVGGDKVLDTERHYQNRGPEALDTERHYQNRGPEALDTERHYQNRGPEVALDAEIATVLDPPSFPLVFL